MKKRRKMRKFLTAICVTCIMLLGSSMTTLADIPDSGSYGDFEWVYDNTSKTLTFSGNGKLDILYGDLDRREAEIIRIPFGCTSLTDNTLRAFSSSSVKTYVVDENNGNYATEDGVLYTKDMTMLIAYPAEKTTSDFIVPGTVTTIKENAFRDAQNLKSVTLPSGLEQIECNAFYNTGLTSVKIPASVYRIYDQAFSRCSSLTSIQVEQNKWDNGTYFANDGVLYSRMNYYDENMHEMKICALECYPAGKKNLSFSVPSGVTEIGMNAFQGVSSLQTVNLPMTVTRISGQAFAGATALVNFYIPSSVTTMIGSNGTGEDCGIREKTSATIYGMTGSVAQTYATNNKVKFVETKDPSTSTTSKPAPYTPMLTKAIGQKALKLSAAKLPLQIKKSTNMLKVTKKAAGDSVVKWTSSRPSVVAVNKTTGKLTAKKTGKATITVTMKSGALAKCTVTVQKKAVKTKKLKLSKTKIALKKGTSYTIKVTKDPLTSLEKITFRSSNKKVARVSSKGKVTAKKKGTATITVKTSGGTTKKCKVTVK